MEKRGQLIKKSEIRTKFKEEEERDCVERTIDGEKQDESQGKCEGVGQRHDSYCGRELFL